MPRSTIGKIMTSVTQLFDKKLVEKRRARAITTAKNGADFFLEIVTDELSERLNAVDRDFNRAVELHGYTGTLAKKVLKNPRVEHVVSIEVNENGNFENIPTIVSSIENVPLDPQSAQLILSPLSLHLVNDVPGVFAQIMRSLSPDGLFLAAIPTSGSLEELRDVLSIAESEITGGISPRVIPFATIQNLGGLLQRCGFTLPVIDVENYTVRYDSLFNLMYDLRAMGMTNPLLERCKTGTRKSIFLRAAELYAAKYSDTDGRIRATFSVAYLSGWSPHPNQQKPLKPGSAQHNLGRFLKNSDKT